MQKSLFLCVAAACLVGCHANYSVSRVPQSNLQTEGTVVFDRASKNNLFFGNRSLVEYVEVVYDRFSVNEAGQPVVEVGIRYKGPDSWTNWYKDAPPQLNIAATCNFYETPAAQAGGPIVYATSRLPIVIKLGETFAYKAVCPLTTARGYQLVLGE